MQAFECFPKHAVLRSLTIEFLYPGCPVGAEQNPGDLSPDILQLFNSDAARKTLSTVEEISMQVQTRACLFISLLEYMF